MAGPPDTGQHELDRTMSREPKTTLPEDLLRSLNEQIVKVPDGFNVHRKLKPFLEKRREPRRRGRQVDWAHAESLAFASLLALGVPIRLTGPGHRARHVQPAPPGAPRRRERATATARCRTCTAPCRPFELHNSPLSEQGCLGFEYGYSVQDPDALVLWEAQFGDFVNSAQVILDQFLVSGLAKWGADLTPDAAAAPRLRGLRSRALLRPRRALPPGLRRGQHARGQRDHARAVLPPAAPPGAGVQAAAAGA